MKNLHLAALIIFFAFCRPIEASYFLVDGVLEQLRVASGNAHLTEGEALTLLFKGDGKAMLNKNPTASGSMLPSQYPRYVKPGDRGTSILDIMDNYAIKLQSKPYWELFLALETHEEVYANEVAAESDFNDLYAEELYLYYIQHQFNAENDDDLYKYFQPIVLNELKKILDENNKNDEFSFNLTEDHYFVINPGTLSHLKDYPCLKNLWNEMPITILTFKLSFTAKITNQTKGGEFDLPLEGY